MANTYVCGKANSVQHALSCTKGGLPIYRGTMIYVRDLTASLMEEVSRSTEKEPMLQLLSGESLRGASANIQDEGPGTVDIKCRGVWISQQDAFFDVRVFNTLASSNLNPSIDAPFRKHEQEKRRVYEKRIREIEHGHGSFTPLVFSASGGMGPVYHDHCLQETCSLVG